MAKTALSNGTRTAWSTFGVPLGLVIFDVVIFSPGLFRLDGALLPTALVLVVYALVAGGVLVFRHRYPAQVFVVLIAHALLAKGLLTGQYIPTLTVLAGLTSVASHFRPRWSLLALVVAAATILAGIAPHLLRYHHNLSSSPSVGPALLVYVAVAVFAWVVGWWIAERRERIAALTRELERANELEQARMERAVQNERLRIASELHDIVASSVTVMVLQAAGGTKALDRDPERARQSLRHIESTGKEAMEELRRMLGMLRSSQGVNLDTVASDEFRMRDLQAVLLTIERAGVGVTLFNEGEPYVLNHQHDVTVSRIVQESLTNTVKYAGKGAKAKVVLRWGSSMLDVEVVDDGGGSAPELSPGMSSGAGLVGLRDRVTALNGIFEAGPQPEGGFRVWAQLPINPSLNEAERHRPVSLLARAVASVATFHL